MGFGWVSGRSEIRSQEVLVDKLADTDLLTEGEGIQNRMDSFRVAQEAWLSGRRDSDAATGAKTFSRKGAYGFLRSFEWALMQTCNKTLMDLRPLPCTAPSTWTSLTLSTDQGSDMQSGIYFMIHHLGLNVDFLPDQSHQWQRDAIASWGKLGWTGWTRLCTAVMNTWHGPFESGSRFSELQASGSDLVTMLRKSEQPLILALQDELVDELALRDVAVAGEDIWGNFGGCSQRY